MKLVYIYIILGIALCSACTKEKKSSDSFLQSFDSLVVDKPILFAGESATITAYAHGIDIQFYWKTQNGTIHGSGKSVTFVPSPCSIGEQTITCTVKASNTNKTKDIIIEVK